MCNLEVENVEKLVFKYMNKKIFLTGVGKLSHCRTKVIEASNCATGGFEKMFQILLHFQ